MKINSVFGNLDKIPVKYTADGENINPPIEILEAPKKAQSFVLIVDDHDAMPPKGFTHWIAWNIPLNVKKIEENSIHGEAIEGVNDAGKMGYIGPAPPSGVHIYFFKVFALDTNIDLPEGSTKADLEKAIRGHVVEEAMLIGIYSRD